METLKRTTRRFITGAGANTATDNVGGNKGSGGKNSNTRRNGGGFYSGAEKCVDGMLGGAIAGAIGDWAGAALDMIGGGIAAGCHRDSNGGSAHSGGGISVGTCNW